MLLINGVMLVFFILGLFPFVKANDYFRLVGSSINGNNKVKNKSTYVFTTHDIVKLIMASGLYLLSGVCLLISMYLYTSGVPQIPEGLTVTETYTYSEIKSGVALSTTPIFKTDTVAKLLESKSSLEINDYIYDTVDYSITAKYIKLHDVADYLLTGNASFITDSQAKVHENTSKYTYTGIVEKGYIYELHTFKVGDYYLTSSSAENVFSRLDMSKPVKIEIVYNSGNKIANDVIKEYKVISAINV